MQDLSLYIVLLAFQPKKLNNGMTFVSVNSLTYVYIYRVSQ